MGMKGTMSGSVAQISTKFGDSEGAWAFHAGDDPAI